LWEEWLEALELFLSFQTAMLELLWGELLPSLMFRHFRQFLMERASMHFINS
jgi:hypothetical protein